MLTVGIKGTVMLQAKDIMTSEVICVCKDTPIVEAIQVMADNNITGVPVVEEDRTLIGVLSEQDVLRLFHTYRQEGWRTAGEFMTQPAVFVKEDDPLLDVCYRLRDSSIRRVPVTLDGIVTGIITRADILKCTLQLLREECHAGTK